MTEIEICPNCSKEVKEARCPCGAVLVRKGIFSEASGVLAIALFGYCFAYWLAWVGNSKIFLWCSIWVIIEGVWYSWKYHLKAKSKIMVWKTPGSFKKEDRIFVSR